MTMRRQGARRKAFLFTDIEDSTRLWEAHPQAMRRALKEHNAIVQRAVDAYSGEVFKTIGDAFCCTFANARDAVNAAIEAQRALGSEHWPHAIAEMRVRMAVHCGSATCDGGDYFGPEVNRVARVMSVAHGGQILLSSSAARELGVSPLEGVTLRNLGSHRLKDLKAAEEMFQVMADGIRIEFPELASLDAHPNNLPSQLSSFVGREAELIALRSSLQASRVVTIAGMGGVGKTRLALHVAADVVAEFPGGVYLTLLAGILDGDLIASAVATALGLTENPHEPILTTISRFVGAKAILIVLDNAEQIAPATASFVREIASRCPRLRFLITSREPLHLTGELVHRLAPLSDRDSEELFRDRAESVAGPSVITADAAPLLNDVCRRLEGIPLAIELAASRAGTIPLQRLAQKLNIEGLTNKDPTASQRHRTLRDTIEWSYRLLDDFEQRVLVALAVFAGGCTLDALEKVADEGVDDQVASLIDKSLVQIATARGAARYRLLQPVAEFARQKIDEKHLADLRQRHFAVYDEIAKASVSSPPRERMASLSQLDADLDNVRAALAWCTERDVRRAAQLASALGIFWRNRGSYREARECFARFLAQPELLTPWLQANLMRQSAGLAAMQDDYRQAHDLATRALRLFESLNDDTGMGQSLCTLGEVAHRRGDLDAALAFYKEALPHLDAAGHFAGKMACIINQGMIARQSGSLDDALKLLRQADDDIASAGDSELQVQVRIERAWAELTAGNSSAAERCFASALETSTANGLPHETCYARLGEATLALLDGQLDKAMNLYRAAFREARDLRAQILAIDAVYGVAAVHVLRGEVERAARDCKLAEHMTRKAKCGARWGIAYAIATQSHGVTRAPSPSCVSGDS